MLHHQLLLPCFPCCNQAFQRSPPPRAVHAAAMIYQSPCYATMAPRRLMVLMVCLRVAIASAFVLESSPAYDHRAASISRMSISGSAYVVPAGRGQGRLTSTRSTRHHSTTCSVPGQSRDPTSAFSPRRCRGQAYRCAMFNSVASMRIREQDSSCDGGQSRAARSLGKTAISSMSIGVEDLDEGRRERDHAVCGVEGKGGEGAPSANVSKSGKTSKGWEYWSYRALLLGVAAIWGTNFPVVRGDLVVRLCDIALGQ